MKNLTKFTALLLAMLLLITSFAVCVLAEPEGEEPGTENSGNEESGGEESGGEDPGTDDPTPPETYTVNIIYTNAGAQSVTVTMNDSVVEGNQYIGTADQPLYVRVDPKDGYELLGGSLKSGTQTANLIKGDTDYYYLQLPLVTPGATYEVHINSKPIPVNASVSVWAKDDALADVPFDAYINSTLVENIENRTVKCMTGDKLTLTFNVEGFDVANAFMKLNGVSVALEGNSYTFVVENPDNAVQFGYNIVPVNFVVNNGPADIKIQPEEGAQQTIPDTRTVHFKKGVPYVLTFGAGPDRIFDTVEFAGCDYVGEGNEYTVTANQETTITVNLSVDEQLPDGFNVNVQCGANGEVTVNDSDDQTVKVDAGEDVVITAIPDEGYIVDVFTVNGETEEFIDNIYIIENISRNVNIRVTFKKDDGEASKPIEVDDIDWDADAIIINLRGGKKVVPEVFEKISETKADGKFVEFKSDLGTVYVPLGKPFVGNFENADLRIKQVTDAKTLKDIKELVGSKTGASVEYKAFSLDFGIQLPKGTYLTFNLGSAFADYTVDVLEFDTANKKFAGKGEVVFDEKGVSGKQEYNNEKILLCAKKVPPTVTIQSIVKNNVGGSINPLGSQTVKLDAVCNYSISANSGYIIKQLLVNGTPVEEAVGKTNYIYPFTAIEDLNIEVEFEVGGPGADSEENTSPIGTIIVIVIIVLVALAGAGTLFYVKWSQEKF